MGTVHQLTYTLAELPVKVKISEAKEHIKLAEQADQKALEHYTTAGNLLAAANHKDGISYADLAKGIGKSKAWVVAIVTWFRETDHTQRPFAIASQEKRERTKQIIGQAPDRLSSVQAPRQPSASRDAKTKSVPPTKTKTKNAMKTEIENFLAWAQGLLSDDRPNNIMEELEELTTKYGAVEMESARKKIKQHFRTLGNQLLKLAKE